MAMSITEIERALRSLRLSGMSATLQARALQVGNHEMDFMEAFAWLVQDELDRRRSRLLDRRYALSGLPERKELKSFDWSYNPRLPRREVLELVSGGVNIVEIGRVGIRAQELWGFGDRAIDRAGVIRIRSGLSCDSFCPR